MRQDKTVVVPPLYLETNETETKQRARRLSKQLITVEELHDCCVSLEPYTIRKKVREGIIPAYRIGGKRYLIDPDEAIKSIKKNPY
ncbi:MAG: hypothetical protein AABZ39_04950 [Spirochaetota bacterium]